MGDKLKTRMVKVASLVPLLLISSLPVHAERFRMIPTERMETIITFLRDELMKVKEPPVKVVLDEKRAIGLFAAPHVGVMGALDRRFDADALNNVREKPVMVGALFLIGVVPVVNGKPAPDDKIRLLEIMTPSGEKRNLATLYLRLQGSGDKLQLDVLSASTTPLLTVPVVKIEDGKAPPLALEVTDMSPTKGNFVFRFLGKTQASLELRPLMPVLKTPTMSEVQGDQ